MAHDYRATITWERGTAPFLDNQYSRGHLISFDGGVSITGSSAPAVVPPPLSRIDAVDPEEALVGALSSCHMLFFLAFCAKKGFRVDRYEDNAVGTMSKNEKNKLFVSNIVLRPSVTYSGDTLPSAEDIAHLHHRAHEECYIGHSIRADVEIVVTPPNFA